MTAVRFSDDAHALMASAKDDRILHGGSWEVRAAELLAGYGVRPRSL